ncbi:hypothetical protein LC608_34585 [Nostoc sp. XA010]|uniref:hypothetical protein n=1 Tax=Nostoc sp. XA010 TaxID=2780407 RepID=UPI001E61319B|nr:hypothetical protein [Nostoc sp. XA010]MCC5661975.1 hypothetical protein [Nostoc sp. XA010]
MTQKAELSQFAHERIKPVVCNNAVWCDTICRVHGLSGEFKDVLWLNRHETPRFYPNVVTLVRAEASAIQLQWIQNLLEAGISGNWGVKDSFCTLNLVQEGFAVLFEAQWLYRSASLPKADKRIADVRWLKIDKAPALMEWETAWAGHSANEVCEKQPQIFMPSVLVNENIAVLAAYKSHRIIAGAIASPS